MIIDIKRMLKLSILISIVITVTVFNSAMAQGKKTQNVVSIANVEIAVDLNRDGKVEFAQWEYTEGEQYEGCTEINNNRTPTDKTTPQRPYRFWLNNDLDLVNHNGSSDNNFRSCDGQPKDRNGNQICEIWDEDPLNGTKTNTSGAYIDNIENIRDLEDFSPLAIKTNKHTMTKLKDGELQLLISAKGLDVKLFKSSWSDTGINRAHAYIYNKNIALTQIAQANSFATRIDPLENGGDIKIPEEYIKKNEEDGVLKFIFEGVTTSAICTTNASQCYLLVKVVEAKNNDVVLAESKLYLDLHDIKDFYELATAGTADNGNTLNYEARYDGSAIVSVSAEQLGIFDCVAQDVIINRTRAVQVHGWRMRDAEKLNFAETSFKRLYWSGYQGRFSAVTWPTGWFKKPSHIYDIFKIAGYVFGNIQNYNNSESVARRVGKELGLWLVEKRRTNPEVYLIAHSMGNVVASEALRESLITPLVQGYAATNAATVAGAYDQQALNINIQEDWLALNQGVVSIPPGEYDMPPDLFRFDLTQNDQIQHAATTDIAMDALINQGYVTYYSGISNKSARIINFYNDEDAALDGWEINQKLKPDDLNGFTWIALNQNMCPNINSLDLNQIFDMNNCLLTPTPPRVEIVTTHFYVKESNNSGREVFWSNSVDKANILSHIIPARTKALGQSAYNGEISGNIDLGLTGSNQDHSAIFHGYFGDPEKSRSKYWSTVMLEVFGFPIETDSYSGLAR